MPSSQTHLLSLLLQDIDVLFRLLTRRACHSPSASLNHGHSAKSLAHHLLRFGGRLLALLNCGCKPAASTLVHLSPLSARRTTGTIAATHIVRNLAHARASYRLFCRLGGLLPFLNPARQGPSHLYVDIARDLLDLLGHRLG